MELGYCLSSTGVIQDMGVTPLDDEQRITTSAQMTCLVKCLSKVTATGCEVRWEGADPKCLAHTLHVSGGNNVTGSFCWVLSKCKGRHKGRLDHSHKKDNG